MENLALVKPGTPAEEINLDKIEEATKPKKKDRHGFTTHGGVVLRYQPVNSQLLFKAWAVFTPPKPPEVYIEERGRYEPNTFDQGYRAELAKYNRDYTLLSTQVYFMRGLTVTSIPDGVIGPESDEWMEGIENVIGDVKGKLARQTAWLMYSGVLTDGEQTDILNDLAIISGMLSEADVEEAMSSFPSDEGQQADT